VVIRREVQRKFVQDKIGFTAVLPMVLIVTMKIGLNPSEQAMI
jgi:hypothetical protein